MGPLSAAYQKFYSKAMYLRWRLNGYDHVGELESLMVPGWWELKILDVGSGSGSIASDHRFSQVNITCVDASSWAVKACKQRGLKALKMDIRDIPNLFHSGDFDVIWCLDVLEHLEKKEALKLLGRLEKMATRQVIVFLPLGYFPQDHELGISSSSELVKHHSTWEKEDFILPGYRRRVLRGHHWDIRMYCSSLEDAPYPIVRDAMWAVKDLSWESSSEKVESFSESSSAKGFTDQFRYRAFSDPQIQVSKIVEKAKTMLGERKPLILDVGAGWGQHREYLHELGGTLYELDVEESRDKDILGSVYSLPFADETFDVVAIFMVLEHLHSPALALGELGRVLKKDGLLLLTTIQYWHTHGWPEDYYRYTRNGLDHLLKKAEFEVRECWSMGGPFLVAFHVLELNLGLNRMPNRIAKGVYHFLAFIFDKLDYLFFRHEDKRKYSDSVGWSLVARKRK